MNYLELLQHSYKTHQEYEEHCAAQSRLEYLGEHIFGFTTYDGEISSQMARDAVEVCQAITDRTTSEYIQDPERYRAYLTMVNMPFFAGRLSWGTSIRGAWWDIYEESGQLMVIDSCALYDEYGNQSLELRLDAKQWYEFMAALIQFAEPEMSEAAK